MAFWLLSVWKEWLVSRMWNSKQTSLLALFNFI